MKRFISIQHQQWLIPLVGGCLLFTSIPPRLEKAAATLPNSDARQLVQVVKQHVDPERRFRIFQVTPSSIVLDGNYAMVGWNEEHTGGILVLQKQASQWLVIGGGGGVPNDVDMVRMGVPKANAQRLARKWLLNN